MNKLSKVLIVTAATGAIGFGIGKYFDLAPLFVGEHWRPSPLSMASC